MMDILTEEQIIDDGIFVTQGGQYCDVRQNWAQGR
jgi:hypothetical protein